MLNQKMLGHVTAEISGTCLVKASQTLAATSSP
jgi:hypothetical protein